MPLSTVRFSPSRFSRNSSFLERFIFKELPYWILLKSDEQIFLAYGQQYESTWSPHKAFRCYFVQNASISVSLSLTTTGRGAQRHPHRHLTTRYLAYAYINNPVLVVQALTKFLDMATEVWNSTNLHRCAVTLQTQFMCWQPFLCSCLSTLVFSSLCNSLNKYFGPAADKTNVFLRLEFMWAF